MTIEFPKLQLWGSLSWWSQAPLFGALGTRGYGWYQLYLLICLSFKPTGQEGNSTNLHSLVNTSVAGHTSCTYYLSAFTHRCCCVLLVNFKSPRFDFEKIQVTLKKGKGISITSMITPKIFTCWKVGPFQSTRSVKKIPFWGNQTSAANFLW